MEQLILDRLDKLTTQMGILAEVFRAIIPNLADIGQETPKGSDFQKVTEDTRARAQEPYLRGNAQTNLSSLPIVGELMKIFNPLISFLQTVNQSNRALQSGEDQAAAMWANFDAPPSKPQTPQAAPQAAQTPAPQTSQAAPQTQQPAPQTPQVPPIFQASAHSSPTKAAQMFNTKPAANPGSVQGLPPNPNTVTPGVSQVAQAPPFTNINAKQIAGSGKAFDLGPAVSNMAKVTAALSALAAVAVRAVESLINFSNAARNYVELFSPGAVVIFDQAVRDLGASIGASLIPVVTTATNVMRLLAASILSLNEPLQAMFKEAGDLFYRIAVRVVNVLTPLADLLITFGRGLVAVSDIAMSVFEPVMKGLAASLEVLAPMFRAIGAVLAPAVSLLNLLLVPLQMLGDAFQAMGKVLSAFYEWIAGLLGNDVSSLIDGFTDLLRKAFQGLISALVQITAQIAMLFGARGFVAEMAKAFAPKKSADGLAAMTDVRFISHTDFGRQAMVAAANAMGGIDKQKSGDEWLSDIAVKLEKMLEGPDQTFWSTLKTTLADVTYKTIAGTVVQAASDAIDYIRGGSTVTGVGSFSGGNR